MAKDEKEEKNPKPGNKIVTITVDHKPKTIERGNYDLSEFKLLVGIDPGYDVDEVINGEFKPLEESKKVHIKGDEVFVSHVKTGSSS